MSVATDLTLAPPVGWARAKHRLGVTIIMMKRALIPFMLCVAGVTSAQQKSQPSIQPKVTVMKLPGVQVAQAVPATGTSRIYDTTAKEELFFYDRTSQSSTRVGVGVMYEPALAPKRDRIAFARQNEDKKKFYIWALPLDPTTGTASGPVRRLSVQPGRFPAFSP